jgi:methionyl-tRNA formyltransferase
MSNASDDQTVKRCFALASHTPWGRSLFDRVQAKSSDRWLFVSAPDVLAAELDAACPRLVFFPHWSHIIPESVWKRHECVIFHMTDLPYGRGGSPLQNLIIRGHSDTVISAIRCVAEIDAGPVFMKRPLSLRGSAHEIFSRAMAVIEGMIDELVSSLPEPHQQEGEVVRFTRRTPQMSRIDGSLSLDAIYNQIRMLDADGYPRAFTDIEGLRLEFDNAVRTTAGVEARVTFKPRLSEIPPAGSMADSE